jgi:hypothetical protein
MSSGLLIDNKSFTSGLYRILRNYNLNGEPGYKYVSYYNEPNKVGVTSPVSFGMRCPIEEYIEELKNTAEKEVRDAAWEAVRPTTEYWMAVLDMRIKTHNDKPNIHILRAKRTLYDQVLTQMLNEDVGTDICDLEEGCNASVSKTGQKLDTVWKLAWGKPEPVSDDAAFVEQVREAACKLSVQHKFFAVDWEKLGQLYEILTGAKLEDHEFDYASQTPVYTDAVDGEDPDQGGEADEPAPTPVAAKSAKKGGKAAPAAADPEEPQLKEGTKVSFNGEGDVQVIGTITGWDETAYEYNVEDEAGEVWGVKPEDATVVEAEEPAEPAPVASKKKSAAKAGKPAPAAPAAAKAAKPTGGKAAPNKPASGGIRSRLTR